MASSLAFAFALGLALVVGCKKDEPPAPPAPPSPAIDAPGWQILASELPSALMSVGGRSATDVFAVGADKGKGPIVFHFDGATWTELHTQTTGDLWWVQAIENGPTLMGGANRTVLRYDGARFEALAAPAPAKSASAAKGTIYGVWGASGDDFYAVGNSGGKDGFIWHFHAGKFDVDALPANLPRMHATTTSAGDAPGFFKVFGAGDDVWVVGGAGTILHRKGRAPFALVTSPTKETLFTVTGTRAGYGFIVVGGSGNGVVLEGASGAFHDATPPGSGLLQGVFASSQGDWASGERCAVYSRAPGARAFTAIDHGLGLPATSSLHAIWVDANGGVWSAGGNVLTSALDGGMLVHFGKHVPEVVLAE